MRARILLVFVTKGAPHAEAHRQNGSALEGFVSGLNGEADWIFETAHAGSTISELETISQAGVHVMGRKTFEAMASYWPSSTNLSQLR